MEVWRHDEIISLTHNRSASFAASVCLFWRTGIRGCCLHGRQKRHTTCDFWVTANCFRHPHGQSTLPVSCRLLAAREDVEKYFAVCLDFIASKAKMHPVWSIMSEHLAQAVVG